jgi:hypothetical protein
MGAVAMCVLALGALTMAGAKPGTVTPVPLEVEFDDVSPGRRITSDGQGSYSDGEQGVAAQIDQYGNVIVNFQTTGSPLRQVRFDYTESLGATGSPPVDEDNVIAPPNSYFATLHPNGPKLQEMALGDSQCLEAGFSFTLDDASRTQYRHSFHRDLGRPIDFTDTSYLVATRTEAGWELEPKADDCQPEIDVIKLIATPTRGKFKFTDHGRYRMSMKMTLTAK